MGRSVLPDESIQGNATFFMVDFEAAEAFNVFVKSNNLYIESDGKVMTVSRVRVAKTGDGKYDIDSEGADLDIVLRKLSRVSGVSMLYQSIPRAATVLHVKGVTPSKCVEILMKKYEEYRIENAENYVYIVKKESGSPASAKIDVNFRSSDGSTDIVIDKQRLFEVLRAMFSSAKREYTLLTKNDALIERLAVTGKEFDAVLQLVLDQAGCSFEKKDDIYVIYQSSRSEPSARLRSTLSIALKYISVTSLQGILPSSYSNSGTMKVDRPTNTVILTGTSDEIGPIIEFIESVDRKPNVYPYRKIDFKYLKPKEALSMVPARFSGISMLPVPGADSIIVECTDEMYADLGAFFSYVDVAGEPVRIKLKYIKPDEAAKYLPTPLVKEDIIDIGDGSTLIFAGSKEKQELLDKYLAIVDKPKSQIKYELLVVQYEKSDKLEWTRSLGNRKAVAGDRTSVLGSFAELLSLKFDVISVFGYLFAAQLNYKLGRNDAKVYADTTLNGLSGQDIKFQNTSTFRYRELDSTTGKVVTNGVTREITSGLIISMNGWVSGDGMITMAVSATVSKQGADLSSSTGNPPPTSEKVVNTTVRTKSGEPVVISGLIQNDDSKSSSGIPPLARIPVLGEIFNDKNDSKTQTEMVIYVVPRVERMDGGIDSDLEEIYSTIVGNGEL